MTCLWPWRVWTAWWQPWTPTPTSDRTARPKQEQGRPSTTASAPEPCPACGQALRDPTVPEGYEQPHCRPCAQAIDRRTLARRTGGEVRA